MSCIKAEDDEFQIKNYALKLLEEYRLRLKVPPSPNVAVGKMRGGEIHVAKKS